jgi:hypothetical protein
MALSQAYNFRDSVGAYMLGLAEVIPEAMGVYWCSGKKAEDILILHFWTPLLRPALNYGSTGRRHWFGYLFKGGLIDLSDFVVAPKEFEVTNSQALTYVLLNVSTFAFVLIHLWWFFRIVLNEWWILPDYIICQHDLCQIYAFMLDQNTTQLSWKLLWILIGYVLHHSNRYVSAG